jgi:hypothetical protein
MEDMADVSLDLVRAEPRNAKTTPERMPIIAMTTNISMRVKPVFKPGKPFLSKNFSIIDFIVIYNPTKKQIFIPTHNKREAKASLLLDFN